MALTGMLGGLGAVGKGIGKAFGGAKKAGNAAVPAAPQTVGSPDTDQAAQSDQAQQNQQGQKAKQGKKDKKQLGQQPRPQKQQLNLAPSFAAHQPMQTVQNPQGIPSYKQGGRVRKTGVALLHKGEHVVPAKRRSMMGKAAHKRTITKP